MRITRLVACRLVVGLLVGFVGPVAAGGDLYTVTLPEGVRDTPVSGRLLLHFIDANEPSLSRSSPIDAPFYESPQPLAGIDVTDLAPGGSVVIDGGAMAWPGSVDGLDGRYRVQVLLDQDDTERSRLEGPGNLYSDVMEVDVSSARDEAFTFTLSHVIAGPDVPSENDFFRIARLRSPMLSAFAGHDVDHIAGIALPAGYHDPANADRHWPATYVVPGFGGRYTEARRYARVQQLGTGGLRPDTIIIVLDPEAPLGHHGFVDSENNGPRGRALVEEFIPYLESQYRLIPESAARIVTGHSSGAWSSLWLATHWPETFGACWASSPDPVDFRAFQRTNLYTDASMYETDGGEPTPSYRAPGRDGTPVVRMTVRVEAAIERVLGPDGRSGEQWAAWDAMFSPRDPATGLPKPMFDRVTGRIDPDVVSVWRARDLAAQLVADWDLYGALFEDRIRLACGELDSFYLDGGVRLLADRIRQRRSHPERSGSGYVWLIPRATHNVAAATTMRWLAEQKRYLADHGW
ncbi:MAG: hypothetical protein KDA25_00005 [Phycisphaerales bacterium]|nr:hypothetical protein [Phycisphaerales bacterium]